MRVLRHLTIRYNESIKTALETGEDFGAQITGGFAPLCP
jgi:hypothetical protein